MQRFNCFNSIMQNSTSEDDKNDDIGDEPDAERAGGSPSKCEVTLPEPEVVDSNWSDNGYWKIEDETSEDDLDALMAELE